MLKCHLIFSVTKARTLMVVGQYPQRDLLVKTWDRIYSLPWHQTHISIQILKQPSTRKYPRFQLQLLSSIINQTNPGLTTKTLSIWRLQKVFCQEKNSTNHHRKLNLKRTIKTRKRYQRWAVFHLWVDVHIIGQRCQSLSLRAKINKPNKCIVEWIWNQLNVIR